MQASPFAELRQLLSKGESPHTWDCILRLFARWPECSERDLALDYANTHLESWSSKLRTAHCSAPYAILCWPLIRHLDFVGGRLTIRWYERFSEENQLAAISLEAKQFEKYASLLSKLRSLRELQLYKDINWIKGIKGLRKLPELTSITLETTGSLESLTGLEAVQGLTFLKANLPRVTDFSAFRTLHKLEELHLVSPYLDADCFGDTSSLRSLKLFRLESCEHLRFLREARQLQHAKIVFADGKGCLVDMEDFKHLQELRELRLLGCGALADLFWLGELKQLEKLQLQGSGESGAETLQRLDKLEELHLRLSKVRSLDLSDLKALEVLELRDCTALEWLYGWEDLPRLEKLTIRNCPRLKGMDAYRNQAGYISLSGQVLRKFVKELI